MWLSVYELCTVSFEYELFVVHVYSCITHISLLKGQLNQHTALCIKEQRARTNAGVSLVDDSHTACNC